MHNVIIYVSLLIILFHLWDSTVIHNINVLFDNTVDVND